MVQPTSAALAALYAEDETAWLEATAELVRSGRLAHVDSGSLAEYLSDMARRDRREVESRLTILLTHVLKWTHQPDHRSRSWLATLVEQQQELDGFIHSAVLRLHAEDVLADTYIRAIRRAVAETGLPAQSFPPHCSYSLDDLLTMTFDENPA